MVGDNVARIAATAALQQRVSDKMVTLQAIENSGEATLYLVGAAAPTKISKFFIEQCRTVLLQCYSARPCTPPPLICSSSVNGREEGR
jgi:hypothetical protein